MSRNILKSRKMNSLVSRFQILQSEKKKLAGRDNRELL